MLDIEIIKHLRKNSIDYSNFISIYEYATTNNNLNVIYALINSNVITTSRKEIIDYNQKIFYLRNQLVSETKKYKCRF